MRFDRVTVDLTPPVPGYVQDISVPCSDKQLCQIVAGDADDGTGEADFQSSGEQLMGYWSDWYDEESVVTDYRFAISDCAGTEYVPLTPIRRDQCLSTILHPNVANRSSMSQCSSYAELHLASNQSYCLHIRGYNEVGLFSEAVSDGVIFDGDAPGVFCNNLRPHMSAL